MPQSLKIFLKKLKVYIVAKDFSKKDEILNFALLKKNYLGARKQ